MAYAVYKHIGGQREYWLLPSADATVFACWQMGAMATAGLERQAVHAMLKALHFESDEVADADAEVLPKRRTSRRVYPSMGRRRAGRAVWEGLAGVADEGSWSATYLRGLRSPAVATARRRRVFPVQPRRRRAVATSKRKNASAHQQGIVEHGPQGGVQAGFQAVDFRGRRLLFFFRVSRVGDGGGGGRWRPGRI